MLKLMPTPVNLKKAQKTNRYLNPWPVPPKQPRPGIQSSRKTTETSGPKPEPPQRRPGTARAQTWRRTPLYLQTKWNRAWTNGKIPQPGVTAAITNRMSSIPRRPGTGRQQTAHGQTGNRKAPGNIHQPRKQYTAQTKSPLQQKRPGTAPTLTRGKTPNNKNNKQAQVVQKSEHQKQGSAAPSNTKTAVPNGHTSVQNQVIPCEYNSELTKQSTHLTIIYEKNKPKLQCNSFTIDTTKIDVNLIKWFTLQNTKVTSLAPLSQLTNLTHIYVSNNNISSLKPLSQFTKLTEIDVSNNQISSLAPLSNLTNLKKINASRNKLITLGESLEKLQKLTHLDVSYNKLVWLPKEVFQKRKNSSGQMIDWVVNATQNKLEVLAFSKENNGLQHDNKIKIYKGRDRSLFESHGDLYEQLVEYTKSKYPDHFGYQKKLEDPLDVIENDFGRYLFRVHIGDVNYFRDNSNTNTKFKELLETLKKNNNNIYSATNAMPKNLSSIIGGYVFSNYRTSRAPNKINDGMIGHLESVFAAIFNNNPDFPVAINKIDSNQMEMIQRQRASHGLNEKKLKDRLSKYEPFKIKTEEAIMAVRNSNNNNVRRKFLMAQDLVDRMAMIFQHTYSIDLNEINKITQRRFRTV